jgi:hypothetical protein
MSTNHSHTYVYYHSHMHDHEGFQSHDELHPHAVVGIHEHGKGGATPHSHKARQYHPDTDETKHHHSVESHDNSFWDGFPSAEEKSDGTEENGGEEEDQSSDQPES